MFEQSLITQYVNQRNKNSKNKSFELEQLPSRSIIIF